MDSFRSWKPRPPSADLRRRLFGARAASGTGATAGPVGVGILNWTVSSALSAAVVLVAWVPDAPDAKSPLARETHALGTFSALPLTAQNTLPAATFTSSHRRLLPATNPAVGAVR